MLTSSRVAAAPPVRPAPMLGAIGGTAPIVPAVAAPPAVPVTPLLGAAGGPPVLRAPLQGQPIPAASAAVGGPAGGPQVLPRFAGMNPGSTALLANLYQGARR